MAKIRSFTLFIRFSWILYANFQRMFFTSLRISRKFLSRFLPIWTVTYVKETYATKNECRFISIITRVYPRISKTEIKRSLATQFLSKISNLKNSWRLLRRNNKSLSVIAALSLWKHANHRVPVDSNQWPTIAFGWNNSELFENIYVPKLRDEYVDELAE